MTRLLHWNLATALVLVVGCAPSPSSLVGQEETLVLEVAPTTVDCVGEMRTQCIQVRSPGETTWRKFYDPIEGFRREDGVTYTLEVGRRTIANPPADGSAYAYRLIRIISREPSG